MYVFAEPRIHIGGVGSLFLVAVAGVGALVIDLNNDWSTESQTIGGVDVRHRLEMPTFVEDSSQLLLLVNMTEAFKGSIPLPTPSTNTTNYWLACCIGHIICGRETDAVATSGRGSTSYRGTAILIPCERGGEDGIAGMGNRGGEEESEEGWRKGRHLGGLSVVDNLLIAKRMHDPCQRILTITSVVSV